MTKKKRTDHCLCINDDHDHQIGEVLIQSKWEKNAGCCLLLINYKLSIHVLHQIPKKIPNLMDIQRRILPFCMPKETPKNEKQQKKKDNNKKRERKLGGTDRMFSRIMHVYVIEKVNVWHWRCRTWK